jgi:hypothetical protein
MTNIGEINLRHTKTYGVTKKLWIAMKICDTLLPMACHVIVTRKIESLSVVKDNNIFN